MADNMAQMELQIPYVPMIVISSESDEEGSSSPISSTDKEESPGPAVPIKPSILTPASSSKKKKYSYGSGKKKAKRLPCTVCSGRFGGPASLHAHMRIHWQDFDKMGALFKSIQHKIKVKELMNGECKCSRCTYEPRDKKPYRITKNFCCHVCDLSFYTANKLSKHMDKHRESYFKMKKLEDENHFMFFNRTVMKV